MSEHVIVGHEEWVAQRRQFLLKEKEFTRLRDELARARRALPWERVEKDYRFEGPRGPAALADLFEGRSQLIVYHFMFAPDWDIGCKSCSFWADQFDAIIPHLRQRDVTLAAVSRAPLAKLQGQAQRQEWSFPWYSSAGSDFNFDYQVSFTPEMTQAGPVQYNYEPRATSMSDLPGISAFIRDGGRIFHTYSTYSRGLDALNPAYQFLDLAAKGRDEEGLPNPMAWVKHRFAYPA
jgi:predicted dithiol-disulfide oxidoreductase (DUF899 family)